ncbi:hypothetical protein [Microbacterium sp. NIBRBAC000506063]|nr:hypothetical protein [Microbacterium sp. NIBRBAC000506063]
MSGAKTVAATSTSMSTDSTQNTHEEPRPCAIIAATESQRTGIQ